MAPALRSSLIYDRYQRQLWAWMSAILLVRAWLPHSTGGAGNVPAAVLCADGLATILQTSICVLYYERNVADLPANESVANIWKPATIEVLTEGVEPSPDIEVKWSLMSPFRQRQSSYNHKQHLDTPDDVVKILKEFYTGENNEEARACAAALNPKVVEGIRRAWASLTTEHDQSRQLVDWMWDPLLQQTRQGLFSSNKFWQLTLGVWDGKMAKIRAVVKVASDSGEFFIVTDGTLKGLLKRKPREATTTKYSVEEIDYFEVCLEELTR